MKKFRRLNSIIIAAALAVSPLALAACGEKTVVQTGIYIADESTPVYSASLKNALEDGIYSFLYRVALRESQSEELPQATKNNLKKYAEGSARAVLGLGIPQDDLISAAGLLKEFSSDAITAEGLAALYGKLCSAAGFSAAGRICWAITLYYYDANYELTMERYDSSGYPYLLERAEELADEKRALEESVGEQNFCNALKLLCSAGTIYGAGGGLTDAMTDSELTYLIRSLGEQPDLSAEGWKAMLALARRLADDTTAGEILEEMHASGDEEKIADGMGAISDLLTFIRSNFTPEQAAMLKDGQKDELLSSISLSFKNEQWEQFFSLFCELEGDYDGIISAACEGYEEYKNALSPRTQDELVAAAGREDFTAILEGYIGGYAPWAAYLIFA